MAPALWLAAQVTPLPVPLGCCDEALAQPLPLSARVVWAREERVYLAASDSIALEAGTLLEFTDRGKKLATGEVLVVHNGELIVARLTSGSLRTVKKLERVRITAERPPLQRVPLLRIGYPAPHRSNLLFNCAEMTLRAPHPPGLYRTDASTERFHRLVRNVDVETKAPWPDTLVIRLFDECADEEIALERGELDAAVFWPGEASAHIRERTGWRDGPSGTRTRGALAAVRLGPDAPADSITTSVRRALARMNQDLFRGDLAPCTKTAGAAPPDTRDDMGSPDMVRFAVDSSCPGQQALERFLNQGASRADDPKARLVHLSYLDAASAPDSLLLAAAEHGSSADASALRLDPQRVQCLFEIRCPVISAPPLRRYLEALSADAIVNLLDCWPAGRKP